jgi:hypothetical protein
MKTYDKNLIEEYCKIKYGYKIVNKFDLTFNDQEEFMLEFIDNWYSGLLKAQHELSQKEISIVLPDDTYQERWKHKFDTHIINGVDIVDIREIKINSIL